jgi:glycogen debranching enzyme
VAVFSKHGTRVMLCVFDATGTQETHRLILNHREGDVHFAFVEGLFAGTRYGFRVDGPWMPDLGLRFDVSKLLIDPYATALDRAFEYHGDLSIRDVDTAALVPKSITQPTLPDATLVPHREPQFIYELPVKAFSKLHPDVPEHLRGTVAALATPAVLNHFKKIGVDTIELMPITAWIDERHLQPLGLHNAWGYNPIQFFAPDPRLAPGGMAEIRETITKLHEHDFRVILDVVLNHTGESDEFGPTLCFRGLDSPLYYAHARGALINDAGTGNTVALNDSHVIAMVIAALRHWVLKAGVDGFRFDLASVMGRMPDGFRRDAPLLKAIDADPVLSRCILIAEPWDIGPGGYQLGNFPPTWLEWNDRYRDDVRRFWRGDDFSANTLATRIAGSSDVFWNKGRPSRSVNFIAAHDGFTLRDMVTYTDKNNFNNGEQNRDGKSHEVTWVGGNASALLATLLLSRGTPMITAGDEFGRSQNGNNNAYAQDNEITWLDWQNADATLIAEVGNLMGLRKKYPEIFSDAFLSGSPSHDAGHLDPAWFAIDSKDFDWAKGQSRQLCLVLTSKNLRIALAFNGTAEVVKFAVPPRKGWGWSKLFPKATDLNCAALSATVFVEHKIQIK